MEQKGNLTLDLSLQFALKIITFCEELEGGKKYVVGKQLLKAGTSIGANVSEAQSPESKADFVHKMKIAAKEANESKYWLTLCQLAPTYPDCEDLISDVIVIQKVLSKIIGRSKT